MMVLPPLIPGIRALLKKINIVLVCHMFHLLFMTIIISAYDWNTSLYATFWPFIWQPAVRLASYKVLNVPAAREENDPFT
jgi:hypothetical protein